MKFILPNFYNNFIEVSNLIDNYYDNKDINICGVAGSFSGSCFHGGVNQHRVGPACLLQHMEGCIQEYQLMDIIIIQFDNPLIEKADYFNRFADIQFSTFGNQKNIYFSVADPDFIEYIIKQYPNIKIILSSNYVDYTPLEDVIELVNKYSVNIKGVISSKIDILNTFKECELKIQYVPLYSCNTCNHLHRCKENEWESILNYSEKSCFYNCHLCKEISYEINDLELSQDRIILFAEPQTDIENYVEQIIDYMNKIGGCLND